MHRSRLMNRASLAVLALGLASAPVLAQTALPDIDVNAQRQPAQPPTSTPVATAPSQDKATPKSAVPDNVPAVIATVTQQQIQEQVNAMDSMQTVKYLPSIEVRERYLGDRNGILATRTTGTVSSAESLVYADNLLLSNLLGNSYSYPPRWDMVSTPEIARADMIYGPFSALYPGNSMGGVLTLTTRMPDKLEIHAAVRGSLENFNLYGTSQRNPGGNVDLAIGDRIENFSFWLSWDHLDAHGHPMSFSTDDINTNVAASKLTATQRAATPQVTGFYQDTDTNNIQRYVFGAYSIDHSIQDMGKIKLGYDFTPTLRATYVAGIWGLQSSTSTETYLTNVANGASIYNTSSGYVNINGQYYKLSSLNPSQAQATHLMQGFDLKSDTRGPFDFEASVSSYDYLTDHSLAAQNYSINNVGLNTQMDGTGWRTADLRMIWRPEANAFGSHEVSFGGHFDEYWLGQNVYNANSATSWDTATNTSLNSASHGRTQTEALYLQDVWSFAPNWKLTTGGREEFWQALNGSNTNTNSTTGALQSFDYADKAISAFSPKASISWQARNDLLLRASAGEAYRFPTVTELYQAVSGTGGIIINNPSLVPEKAVSYDLTAEYTFAPNSVFRLTGFHEDRYNALFSQTNTTVTPTVTEVMNVGQVRIVGVEAAVGKRDLFVSGLDFDGSATYADGVTVSDPAYSAAVGKSWPRIPRWRAKLVATYHPTEKWSLAAALRYSSGAWSTLGNTDVIQNAYGSISQYTVIDMKASYHIDRQWTAALGVDNLGNYKYFVSPHPYPQLTGFAELRYDY